MIGGGGYVAGIRYCTQLKLKTLVIEKESLGACASTGLHPLEALIAAANFVEAGHGASTMGITVSTSPSTRRSSRRGRTASSRSSPRASARCSGQRRRAHVRHRALRRREDARVTTKDGVERIAATKGIIVATGSRPVEIPSFKFDGKTVISAPEAVSLDPLPKRMAIIGGGIIGMEFGGVCSKLGVEVTVVEFLPKVLASMDDDLVAPVTRGDREGRLRFISRTRRPPGRSASPTARSASRSRRAGRPKQTLDIDVVLVAVGFKPNSENVGLDTVGVALDKRGHVVIDDQCRRTSPASTRSVMSRAAHLAHKASRGARSAPR